LDPNFARAYGWLGYTLLVDIQEGWSKKDPKESARLALESAEIGIRKDANDYYTHWNLASICAGIHQILDRKDLKDKAVDEYKIAIALDEKNPKDPDVLIDKADMLSYNGDKGGKDEAIKLILKAIERKIPDYYYWSLGFAYFQKRQYAKAVAALEKIADPPNTAYLLLVASKAKLKKPTPHKKIMARLRSKDPNWTPDHLNQFPFVKQRDQKHYLDSFRASGIPVPEQVSLFISKHIDRS
jgi:adenylate cyclase